MVVPVKSPCIGQIEMFDQELFHHLSVIKQTYDAK